MSSRNASAHEPHNTVEDAMLCGRGEACTRNAPGHGIRPLQARVAVATSSRWQDAIVRSVSIGGWVQLELFASGDLLWVWHHADLTGDLADGAPVALHELYSTLAIGDRLLSVLVTPVGALV